MAETPDDSSGIGPEQSRENAGGGQRSSARPTLDLDGDRVDVEQEIKRLKSDRGLDAADVKHAVKRETDSRVAEEPKVYEPRAKAQDSTRQTIALWLIGLFCAVVVLSFVALFIVGIKSRFDNDFFNKLKVLLDVLLGPIIALLSSAIGFYFGYQQGSTSSPEAKAKLNSPESEK